MMQRNTIILIILLFVVIGGVYLFKQNSQPHDAATMTPSVTSVPASSDQVYTGDLPCADCEGIDAVLTLKSDGSYTMSNTYRGRDVAPYIENGTWTTVKGDATNPDATVYRLTPGSADATVQNYLVSGNELKQLDTDLNLVEAPFNTSLTKKTQ